MPIATTPVAPTVTTTTITPTTTPLIMIKSTANGDSKKRTHVALGYQHTVKVHLRIVGGIAVALDLSLAPSAEPIVPVTAKRVVYTPLQKTNAISAVSSVTGSFESKAKVLRRVPGYEKVTGQMLAGWATPTVGKKRGRSRRDCFERDVLDQMIYTTLEAVDDPDRVAVLANVAHSYEVIKFAAQKVQKMPEYLQDEKVQTLQFSRCWIHDFLAHASLRKRKVTTADKPLPSVEDVQTCMAGIHASRKNYLPGEAVSADETAVLYGLPPSHQYVPEGTRRGSAAHGDDREIQVHVDADGGRRWRNGRLLQYHQVQPEDA